MSGLRRLLLGAGLLAGLAGAALAQQGPESLLPPGFDRPARPSRSPQPPAPARSAAPVAMAAPVIQPQTLFGGPPAPPPGALLGAVPLPAGVTSFNQLMALPQDQIDQLLGLTTKDDIPAGARHAMRQVGLMNQAEGGLPPFSLDHQDAGLVRAALAGNNGHMVSRWGHILLRRALASRLDAPEGLDPADFATLRLALLMRMGEAEAARALAQDVDPDNATPAFAQAALEAYVATEDFTGFCPLLEAVGVEAGGKDPRWQVMQGMCDVFAGNGSEGFARLDDPATAGNLAPGDMLLAQKYAGAAGAGRRSITMDWGKTTDMTPWRYGLALATGLTVPATLMKDAGPRYDYVTASAPMVGLGLRADAADASAGAGILSAAAMVDLYSQIYANDDVTGPPADRALLLRDAYVADTPAARIKAMQGLWEGAADPRGRYARQVLTAYAAARLPASADNADAAGDLIASMLAAGLDANAQRWAGAVEKGSLGWGLIALAAPGGGQVASADIDSFHNADKSANARKSAFLVAGLAGLGRIDDATRNNWTHQLNAGLDTRSHWIELIDGAAAVHNQALVALLAGLGMQGDSWAQMSPRYLYHIVGALSRVGLAAEARMIAAEAVARG